MPQKKIKLGDKTLGMGLYRMIVAYLPKSSFKLSSSKRHQLVKALIDCPVYRMAEPLTMDYSLALAQNIKVSKNLKQLLIHAPDRNNQKENMLFVTALTEDKLPKDYSARKVLLGKITYGKVSLGDIKIEQSGRACPASSNCEPIG